MSAFVAVCSTSLRFILNFNQKHPKDENRLSLDYDVVILTMPSVFLGSMVGVLLGVLIGPTWQMIVFGITVAWSIYTSAKKVFDLLEKEKKTAETESLIHEEKKEEDKA